MNKKAPIYRLCAYTRKSFLKSDLFRVVKINNQAYFDKNQNMPGRGAYLSKNIEVIQGAQIKKTLSKALRMDVKDEVYLEMIQALSEERR